MELSRDIGRRHDDREGFLILITLRMEVAVFRPEAIEALLHVLRIVGLR